MAEAFEKAKAYMQAFMPRAKTSLIRYSDRLPLFDRYGIEAQIDGIHDRQVELPIIRNHLARASPDGYDDGPQNFVTQDDLVQRPLKHFEIQQTGFRIKPTQCEASVAMLSLRSF